MIGPRHGGEQSLRIGVARPGEDLGHPALLDDPAAMDHRDPGRDLRDQSEVVRDVERGDAGLLLQGLEQVEDLPGGDDVERRGRLVEDDAFRLAGEGGGDDDALLLAARGLMRIAPHHLLGNLEPDMGEALLALGPGLPARQAAMAHQHLGELLAER